MLQKKIFTLGVLLITLALILSACGGGAAPAPAKEEPAAEAPATTEEPAAEAPAATEEVAAEAPAATEEPAAEAPAATEEPAAEAATGDKVQIRWFCCLGTGETPEQVEVENRIVEEFNASHPNIELVFEVVIYDAARDALSTQLASGSPPDIVGPVGTSGAEAYHGQWLDLTELIKKNNYDLAQFDQGSVDFYRGGEGQIGIPFAIYPSVLFYRRDMFDEAGLNYPPHKYGEKYKWPDGTEVEWNYDTLRELALKLTVDENGNDATSPDFDPTTIVQYGYEPTFQDLRAVGSYFGAGSFVAEDGKTVQIPSEWVDAWKWLYNGMWVDHFMPTATVNQTDEFGQGNPFGDAGRVAMTLTHLWYTCCLSEAGTNWDVAAVPSHNGKVTANFNADTFRIMKDTKHPDQAFEVLTYLIGDASEELLQIYGGMPARTADQEAFFNTLNEDFPQEVDWPVFVDGIGYADNPSFEGYMPNYNEAFDYHVTFLSKLRTSEGLDMDAEIATLEKDLQAIFDKEN